MSTDELLKRLKPVMDEWPIGAQVWHRASGVRGVIFGYLITPDMSIRLHVDYGTKADFEALCLVSASKVSDGTEGDEWKDGDGKEAV